MNLRPLSREGRQTLIYIMAALSGPALTLCLIAAGYVIATFPGASAEQRLDKFAQIALLLAVALLIVVIRDACFVSIRAIKLEAGAGGLKADVTGEEDNAQG